MTTIETHPPTDGRSESELTDDLELLPPETAVRDPVDRRIVDAINAALADEPNTVVDPVVFAPDSDSDHETARFAANYQELPVIDDGGVPVGWVAPYRAREQFDAALREHLPEGVGFEAVNGSVTAFYTED